MKITTITTTRDDIMDIVKYVRENYDENDMDEIIDPLERAIYALAKMVRNRLPE